MNRDAKQGDDGSPEENSDQHKAEVHSEEVKDRHTSHWDMDYLPTDQVEALHEEGRKKAKERDDENESE